MKYLILLFMFAFNMAVAQEVYYNEDFQSLSIAQNNDSGGVLVQGWDHYGTSSFVDVVRFEGTNQFIRFKSSDLEEDYGIITPEITIKENTKLKFKMAVANNTNKGTIKVKVVKDTEVTKIAGFDFMGILKDGNEGTAFTNGDGDLDPMYEKEVDLSVYAGQKLKLRFEIDGLTNVNNADLFLDDIKLIKETTAISQGTYYTENFQSISIPFMENENTFSTALVQGWDNYNHVKVGRYRGDNQFLVFTNYSPIFNTENSNKVARATMSELLIKENTVLKFKIGIVNKRKGKNVGSFRVKIINGTEEVVIREFSAEDILGNGADFSGGASAKYEKKVDLSAYAGQQLKIRFELRLLRIHGALCMDDIRLEQKNENAPDELVGKVYSSENFQGISVSDHSISNQLPQGWNNYNSECLVAREGINQFILFENQIANKSYKLGMPEFLIQENTKLKFKVAVTDNDMETGIFRIKTVKSNVGTRAMYNAEEKVIATFRFEDMTLSTNGADITNGADDQYEKEIDLSAYVGQKLRFNFEMLAEKTNVKLFLDDIQFVKESIESGTATLNDQPKRTVAVYPNPADNYITINLNEGVVKENQLYALDGRLIKSSVNSENIWIGDLPKGIYLIKITDDSGNQYTHKIIKK